VKIGDKDRNGLSKSKNQRVTKRTSTTGRKGRYLGFYRFGKRKKGRSGWEDPRPAKKGAEAANKLGCSRSAVQSNDLSSPCIGQRTRPLQDGGQSNRELQEIYVQNNSAYGNKENTDNAVGGFQGVRGERPGSASSPRV